jgi:hypothetical protein
MALGDPLLAHVHGGALTANARSTALDAAGYHRLDGRHSAPEGMKGGGAAHEKT